VQWQTWTSLAFELDLSANLIWFDTLQECLVNCPVAVIGNGALPCILVETF